MEPILYRGDLLFATGWKAPNYEVGDIVMWKLPGSPMIVHRVKTIDKRGHYLTKGDNNPADDTGLYAKVCFVLTP